jgi:hypothetical protein
MDWINLAEDRDKWWALVNMEMNLCVPFIVGKFLSANWLVASQKILSFIELLNM